MRSRLLGLGLLTALVVALPAPAADDKKKGDKVIPTIDSDTLPAGDYTGKLLTAPGTDGTFMVEVPFPKLVLKNAKEMPKTNNKYAAVYRDQQRVIQLQNDLAKARNAKDYAHKVGQLQNAVAQLERAMAQAGMTAAQSPYKVTYEKKDVTFHATEDFKVRRLNLPVVYDDKGNVKKYTEEEKKELKGKDKNAIGYEAKADDLEPNMTVKVTLVKAKKKPEDKSKAKADDKEKAKADTAKDDKDKDKPKDDEPKMVVNFILIVSDGDDKSPPTTRDKKNN